MVMFQLLYLEFNYLEGIGGFNFKTGLMQYLTLVKSLVGKMDGNARFFFAGGQHGFVDMIAVHAFAPVFRQQCGVYIDDFIREGF